MSNDQILSWVVSVIGMAGFFLAGRKVWWCWYVNIACQVFWFLYAYVTNTTAFYFTALFYTAIFTKNAIQWTKEHFKKKATVGQYQTKSSPVDAQRFDGGVDNAEFIIDWLHANDIQAWWKEEAASYINTDGRFIKSMPETIRILDREGTLDLIPGEYVVLGANERVYIFEGDAFDLAYERVS